jgi:hypothetical protein
VHPKAAKNFDEKVDGLLSEIAPESRQEASEPPTHLFRLGGHVAATLSEGG